MKEDICLTRSDNQNYLSSTFRILSYIPGVSTISIPIEILLQRISYMVNSIFSQEEGVSPKIDSKVKKSPLYYKIPKKCRSFIKKEFGHASKLIGIIPIIGNIILFIRDQQKIHFKQANREERIQQEYNDKGSSLAENSVLIKEGFKIKRISPEFYSFLQKNKQIHSLEDIESFFKWSPNLQIAVWIEDSYETEQKVQSLLPWSKFKELELIYSMVQFDHNGIQFSYDQHSETLGIKIPLPAKDLPCSFKWIKIFLDISSGKENKPSSIIWDNFELLIAETYLNCSKKQSAFDSKTIDLFRSTSIPIDQALNLYNNPFIYMQCKKDFEKWMWRYLGQFRSKNFLPKERAVFTRNLLNRQDEGFPLMMFILKLYSVYDYPLSQFINIHRYAFSCFTDALEKNLDLARTAISKNNSIIKYLPVSLYNRLKNCDDLTGEKVERLRNINNLLLHNHDLRAFELAYSKTSEELRKDSDICLALLGKNDLVKSNSRESSDPIYLSDGLIPKNINFFSTSRFDRTSTLDDVIRESQSQDIYNKYIPESLRYNRTFNFQAVRQNKFVYKHISYELQINQEIILAQLEHIPLTIQAKIESMRYEELKSHLKNFDIDVKSENVLLSAIIKWPHLVQDLPVEKQKNIYFLLHLIETNPKIYRFLSDEIQNNKIFIIKALEKNPKVYQFLSDEIKNDKEFIVQALERDPSIYHFLSDEIKNDENFVIRIFNTIPIIYGYLSEDLYPPENIMLENLKKDPSIFIYFSQELKNKFKAALDHIDSEKFLSQELKKFPKLIDSIKMELKPLFLTQAAE